MPRSPTLIGWSTGKDSLWALHRLRDDPACEVAGLFSVIDQSAGLVPMHATPEPLLDRQAAALGLPLHKIYLPSPCTDEQYAALMRDFLAAALARGVAYIAFGDLFLEDLRRYREKKLEGTGLSALFPLWGEPTGRLAREMIAAGVKAVITSVDTRALAPEFIGRNWDEALLSELPAGVDPCGENGEFHTFVYNSPLFANPIKYRLGPAARTGDFLHLSVAPA